MRVDSYLTALPCSLSIFTISAMGYCAFAAHRPQPKHKKNKKQKKQSINMQKPKNAISRL